MSRALVLFGLTGDLGRKKLFGALAELARAGLLDGPVIGVGRSNRTDEDLWDMCFEAIGERDDGLRESLDLHYLVGDSQESSTYDELDELIRGMDGPVVYTALPPDLFAGVARGIAASSLPADTRLVVEKPFGHDRTSALELFDQITDVMAAANVFAVDHFLAKAEVENLASFRHRNRLIEAGFDARTVDRIEVTMSEAFGLDGRGGFYESVGALRDVVQNHLLQMIAVLLMEPAENDTAAAFDQARARLLAEMVPMALDDVVLGQFEGYRDLDDVDDDSLVETFVAARLAVDNDRWRGVDIVLRTGKELDHSMTQIVLEMGVDRVRFGIKPDPVIVIDLDVAGEMIEFVVDAPAGHRVIGHTNGSPSGAERPMLGDYATMLASALAGDQRHFAQLADIVRAWEIVDPVLDTGTDPASYAPNSWGPAAARALFDQENR